MKTETTTRTRPMPLPPLLDAEQEVVCYAILRVWPGDLYIPDRLVAQLAARLLGHPLDPEVLDNARERQARECVEAAWNA